MSFDANSVADESLDGLSDLIKGLIEKELENHMDGQPYSVECDYCGKSLDVIRSRIDGDYDLHIRVSPCDCQEGE